MVKGQRGEAWNKVSGASPRRPQLSRMDIVSHIGETSRLTFVESPNGDSGDLVLPEKVEQVVLNLRQGSWGGNKVSVWTT